MTDTPHDHRSSGNPELDALFETLLESLDPPRPARAQLFEMLVTIAELSADGVDRLDAKIANAALQEMAHAFRVFAPYRDVPKVTMFGSARTLPNDPLYAQARDLAAALAAEGWMVVTGAGPGIMAAGLEGAGREQSMGINIRLPFEQGANEFIAADPKLVEMRYFFTRKLMLMKESDGFVLLPGGFGTLDEGYELLTLLQTGKADPAPLITLELPGGTYWSAWERFLREEVATRGLIDPDDLSLFRVTDDVAEATGEILGFYRNYHSRRFVGSMLVLRLKAEPTDAEVKRLSAEFGDIATDGVIRRTGPFPPERNDHPELPRLALRFDLMHHGRLRMLIDAINALESAPPVPTAPPRVLDVD
ncbi:MAG TPA: TIGR00730 family Rossman fold protein [Acidimicrobiales bacterium]|nr:TIGR00730 family Rossman fold protein [Acidimicrobiales bacterium]